jgi:hypothetical protein
MRRGQGRQNPGDFKCEGARGVCLFSYPPKRKNGWRRTHLSISASTRQSGCVVSEPGIQYLGPGPALSCSRGLYLFTLHSLPPSLPTTALAANRMPPPPSSAARLRLLLAGLSARQKSLALPGAFNGLVARAVAHAGFEATYVSGAGVAAGMGLPDVGLAGELRGNCMGAFLGGVQGWGCALNMDRLQCRSGCLLWLSFPRELSPPLFAVTCQSFAFRQWLSPAVLARQVWKT